MSTPSINVKVPTRTVSVIMSTYFIIAFALLGAKIAGLITTPWALATVMLWAPVALVLSLVLIIGAGIGIYVLLKERLYNRRLAKEHKQRLEQRRKQQERLAERREQHHQRLEERYEQRGNSAHTW